ncbi:MAG: acyltransferase [Oscillospiraceae bacterium]|nr:acyltransferase [Oscillospiraceae bacterium]
MKRLDYLDYAKALAIIFIVSIHVGFSAINQVVRFSTPLFFLATGYSHRPGKRTLQEDAALRFKAILLPFWKFMAFYTVVEMLRAPLFGYGTAEIAIPSLAKLIYGSGVLPIETGTTGFLKEIMSYKAQPAYGVDVILPTSCHLWFLPAMFTGYVMFAALADWSQKNFGRKLISLVTLLLLASVEVVFPAVRQLPYGIGRGAMGAAFMLAGFWLRSGGAEEFSRGRRAAVIAAAALVYIGALCLKLDGSSMVRSVYGPYGALGIPITFFGCAAGAWLLIELCRGIEKLPLTGLKRFLSFTGRNVMTVYSLHMAVKFLLDVFYVSVLHGGDGALLDEYKMGLLPGQSFWYMLLEVAVIIAVCLLLAKLKPKLVKKARTAPNP